MKTTRLQNLFGRKTDRILSVYFTAGFPAPGSTGRIIKALSDKGVDMIEVGAPFSDPMADGKTIQHSSAVALRGGMTLRRLFDEVKACREEVPDTPLVLMGYLNPVMHYELRAFFERCKQVGIDALIIPDLPLDEYRRSFAPLCKEFAIPVVMLVTPETEEERIREIDAISAEAFIYVVSSASTTGARNKFEKKQTDYFRRLKNMGLRSATMIGFGISNRSTLEDAFAGANGAIIGSKFIKCLEEHPSDPSVAVDSLLDALNE